MVYRIAIVHPDNLMKMGGAEAVAVNTIQSLQGQYELDIHTLGKPNIKKLNSFFNCNIDQSSINRIYDYRFISDLLKPPDALGYNTDEVKQAIFSRLFYHRSQKYDLTFCTKNEIASNSSDTIIYIHFPVIGTKYLLQSDEVSENVKEASSFYPIEAGNIKKIVNQVSELIRPVNKQRLKEYQIVTNSNYVRELVKDVYPTNPKTIYPPVPSMGSREADSESEDDEINFISIGKVTRSKNINRNIQIIDQVKDFNDNVNYKIIGTIPKTNYADRIKEMATERDYVELTGQLERDTYEIELQQATYGLHGHDLEHFGIGIAEMVKVGTIPFVPNGGGQVEVVGNHEKLIYDSVEDVTSKITEVMKKERTRSDIQKHLSEQANRFGEDIFRGNISSLVSEVLGES